MNFVCMALVSGKNLKGNRKYGVGTKLYLNYSFIPQFSYFNYLIRMAIKDKTIHRYKVRNGVNLVQRYEGDEIGHPNDLINIGIVVPDRVPK